MDAAAWRRTLRAGDDRFEMQPPAEAGEIAAAERRLAIRFPAELRTLYEATSGVYDKHGEWYLIWLLGDVAYRNLEAWNGRETAERRRFLGFGDDGTGDPFCVALDGGSTVFSWSPIEQEARPLAPNLHEFWVGWLSGEIKT